MKFWKWDISKREKKEENLEKEKSEFLKSEKNTDLFT